MDRNRRAYSKMKKLTALLLAACLCVAGMLTGCGGDGVSEENGAPQIDGLTFESEMQLERAEGFSVYRYEGGYSLIDIHDSQKFLIVPENAQMPEKLPEDVTALQQPVDHIYLAATATMAMFCSMDAMDHIRMSSIKADDWTFDEPKKAMESGDIIYAGKYSAPDYETMLDEECDLAIESTMIDHTPEVREMIEDVDIPVLIDRSSYEDDPMGRAEWIKLYSVITGTESQAEEFYSKQLDSVRALDDFENTEKTVAFFYISSDSKVVARSSSDYVPKMIEIAGGRYIFSDLENDKDTAAVDMSTETFFDTAADADYIIYNTSIDGTVRSMDDLIGKDPIMKKMKAVKEGKCWVTGSSMYQRTDLAAEMILDFHKLFTEEDPQDLKYLEKLR